MPELNIAAKNKLRVTIIAKEAILHLKERLKITSIRTCKVDRGNETSTLGELTFVFNQKELELPIEEFSSKFIEPAVQELLAKFQVPEGKKTLITTPLADYLGKARSVTLTYEGLSCRVSCQDDTPLGSICTIEWLFRFE